MVSATFRPPRPQEESPVSPARQASGNGRDLPARQASGNGRDLGPRSTGSSSHVGGGTSASEWPSQIVKRWDPRVQLGQMDIFTLRPDDLDRVAQLRDVFRDPAHTAVSAVRLGLRFCNFDSNPVRTKKLEVRC